MTTKPRGTRRVTALRERLAPLIRREIASIAALDSASAAETAPDFVVLFTDTKLAKQANVEQLAAVMRAHAETPEESGGLLKPLLKAQAAVLERVSRAATLRSLRVAEAELLGKYVTALEAAGGVLERRALRKAVARALVHVHVLTAHIAHAGGAPEERDALPHPLDHYLANPGSRVCMRCNLDRPGRAPALQRSDPHPFTYICAGCHDDVLGEFPADLASQMDRWPGQVREARVIQRALGRPSKLNAIHKVLFPLCGLAAETPVPAADRAVDIPAMTPVPGPAPGETAGDVEVRTSDDSEGRYCAEIFSYRAPRRHW